MLYNITINYYSIWNAQTVLDIIHALEYEFKVKVYSVTILFKIWHNCRQLNILIHEEEKLSNS